MQEPERGQVTTRTIESQRLVRAIAALLAAQTLLLVGVSVWLLSDVTWVGSGLDRFRNLAPGAVSAVGSAGLFLPIGILALVAAVTLLLRLRAGWFLAMIAQVLALSAALLLYFTSRPVYAYPVMLLGVILVLYLNSFSIRAAFHTLPHAPALDPTLDPGHDP